MTTEEMILEYIGSIGKGVNELKDVRIVGQQTVNSHPVLDIELVFGNQWVTYTRIAKIMKTSNGPRYKSITRRTRLHVPLDEVPDDAEFFVGPDGPFVKGVDAGADTPVEVEFFYSKGEGAIAGNLLWVDEMTLLETFGQDKLAEFVHGCKFDFWSVCYKIATGKESVF